MTRYVTPLPGLLARATETLLNRLIRLDPAAPSLVEAMGAKALKVELEQLNIDLYFQAKYTALQVSAESDDAPATTIRGTPMALLALAVPDRKTPGSGVAPGSRSGASISGDAELARRFEQLMRRLDPDWEAGFSEYFGDFLGYQLHACFRQGRQATRRAKTVGTEQMGAWLGEESGLVVNRPEFESFAHEVDALREAVDRLQQKT